MERSLSLRRYFIYGVAGGFLAAIIQFIGAMLLNVPFPPEAIFKLLIAPVPGSVQSVVVENLGEYAKYTAFVSASIAYVLGYGVLGALAGYFGYKSKQARSSLILLITLIFPTVLGLGLETLVASSVSTLSSSFGWISAAVLILLANAVNSTVFIRYSNRAIIQQIPTTRSATTDVKAVSSYRRGFLTKSVIVAAAAVVAIIGAKVGLSIFSGQPVVQSNNPIPVNPQSITTTTAIPTSSGVTSTASATTEGLPSVFMDPRISNLLNSELTDTRIFYRVDIDPIPPQLNFDEWTLNVHGKVSNPLTLDNTAFLALPATDEYSTFECVSNTINPPAALISNGKWTGVQIATLLNQAALLPEAQYVIFRSADGYSVGIPLERAMHPQSLLAYMMNDNSLPNEHGFPVRAVIPGLYGMMSAKWITDIEVTDQVYLGYWQERGWSNDAVIKTTSIIYYPTQLGQVSATNGIIPIAGIAFAGDRSISKVEVSVDGGQTWNEAFLKPPLSPYSWVLWAYPLTPPGPGSYTILVRATDGTGQLQDQTATNPYPNGATGYNQVQTSVVQ
ncbi:MAG: molybdopterin-dependent oxidoreductase [Candidatus Bathyarchaeia archaeon]